VNALSEWLHLEVWREGGHFVQHFKRGTPQGDIQRLSDSQDQGTRIHFLPDVEIFGRGQAVASGRFRLSFDVLACRLQELAYLTPGVEIRIADERDGRTETYAFSDGIVGFVKSLNRTRTPVHDTVLHISDTQDDIKVDVAMQWTNLFANDTRSFANTIRTVDGGTHVLGLESALTSVISRYAADHDLVHMENGESIRGTDVREGLTCILSVVMSEPEFRGQTKSQLSNLSTQDAVFNVVSAQLRKFLDENEDQARAIVDKALEAFRIRLAARRVREEGQHQVIFEGPTPEAYKTQFGIRSSNWHDSAVWIANDELLGAHAAMCKVGPDSRLLDVCCGSGVVGNSFRDKVGHITGLDITPEMVAISKTRLDEVVHGTVYEIPFADESFEIVSNREVMHLMPHPENMLSEVFRVIKKDGQFVFGQIVPFGVEDAAWMYRIFRKKQPLFHHMFMVDDLIELLTDAGFTEIETSEHLLWESIDVWIDTVETTRRHRQEIRELFYNAPDDVKAIHPFEVLPDGRIRDCWRWVIFSAMKR